jgi:hypothetical protein
LRWADPKGSWLPDNYGIGVVAAKSPRERSVDSAEFFIHHRLKNQVAGEDDPGLPQCA